MLVRVSTTSSLLTLIYSRKTSDVPLGPGRHRRRGRHRYRRRPSKGPLNKKGQRGDPRRLKLLLRVGPVEETFYPRDRDSRRWRRSAVPTGPGDVPRGRRPSGVSFVPAVPYSPPPTPTVFLPPRQT